MAIITLTTDFGTVDGYVGAMRGVLLSIDPQARLVDLSHEIPAQDVRRAAFVLYAATPFFPSDTVHLAVIDPGVGTERRAIAVETPDGCFVGPDNGLFTYVIAEAEEWRAVTLVNSRYHSSQVSETFHGRDLFAPAAAHLSAGVDLLALGEPIDDLVRLPLPRMDVRQGYIEGQILYTDHFGNLVTSIGRLEWRGDGLALTSALGRRIPPIRFPASQARVEVSSREVRGVRKTYGDVSKGCLVALIGSSGFLEIGKRQGSAMEELDARVGAPVTLHFPEA